MSGAVVLPFPERVVLAAYWVVHGAEHQDDLQLKLAASVLLEAVRHGEPVPPDTVDRLALLTGRGGVPREFQRRLAKALLELQGSETASPPPVQVERGGGRRP